MKRNNCCSGLRVSLSLSLSLAHRITILPLSEKNKVERVAFHGRIRWKESFVRFLGGLKGVPNLNEVMGSGVFRIIRFHFIVQRVQ